MTPDFCQFGDLGELFSSQITSAEKQVQGVACCAVYVIVGAPVG